MQEFRVYLIGKDSHVIYRIDVLCTDESSAREKARELAVDYDVELWEGARRIKVYRRDNTGKTKSE